MSSELLKHSRSKLDDYFEPVSRTNFTSPSSRRKPKDEQPTGSGAGPEQNTGTILLLKLLMLAARAPESQLRDIVAYAEEHTEALSDEMQGLLEDASSQAREESYGPETDEHPSFAREVNQGHERSPSIPSLDFSNIQPYRPQGNELDDLFD